MIDLPIPVVEEHSGIQVVRDDLLPGGTKLRYFAGLYGPDRREIVYGSPCEGGAQISLAHAARMGGGKATIFCAARKTRHERTQEAIGLGANVVEVRPGYLSVVQARAREYAERTGAYLLPFGGDIPKAPGLIAAAARSTGLEPSVVWCAAGSGTLARGLALAWPSAALHAVVVGKPVTAQQVGYGIRHLVGYEFKDKAQTLPPFPSDLHYDAKAWEVCMASPVRPLTVFWNVMGPPNV